MQTIMNIRMTTMMTIRMTTRMTIMITTRTETTMKINMKLRMELRMTTLMATLMAVVFSLAVLMLLVYFLCRFQLILDHCPPQAGFSDNNINGTKACFPINSLVVNHCFYTRIMTKCSQYVYENLF